MNGVDWVRWLSEWVGGWINKIGRLNKVDDDDGDDDVGGDDGVDDGDLQQ